MDLPAPPPVAPKDGRAFGWRAGMASVGLLFAGAAVALWLWPWLLAWALAAALAVAGLVLLVSALLARGS